MCSTSDRDKSVAASPLESIRSAMRAIKPPKFDRIVVRDHRIFGRFPRNDHAPSPLLGFPVYEDENMERGVIELRMGDEVIERVHV